MNTAATTTLNTPQKATPGLSWAAYGVAGLVAVGLWLSSAYGLEMLWAVAALAVVALAWAFPRQAFLLVIPLLFLEHDAFSIELPFGRLRAYHLLVAVLLARTAYDALSSKRVWRRTPLDLPITIYLALNAVAIAWSPDRPVAIKIFGLMVLLAALYFLVVNEVRTAEQVKRALRWFTGSALVVAVLGFAQVAAVWLEQTYDIALWSGEVIHSDILSFGRPYATFVEPDWFGAVVMVAMVLSIAYVLSRHYASTQLRNFALTLVFGSALVLSVVRAAWLGALVGIVALLWINRGRKLLDARILLPAAVGLLLGVIVLAIFVPDVVTSIVDRAATLGSWQTVLNEPRYLVVEEGIGIWLSTPASFWLGLGPGAFNVLGSVPFVPPVQQIVQQLVPFQTNALVNVLIDTGVIGLVAFGWLVVRFVRTVRTGLRSLAPDLAVPLLGLSAALIGLAVTYQATTGLWLALTWFLVGLTMAVAMSNVRVERNSPNANVHAS